MPFNYSLDDDSVLSNSSLCFGSIIKSLQIISNVLVRSYRVNQNEFFQFAIFEWKVDSILFATDSASTQISSIQFIFFMILKLIDKRRIPNFSFNKVKKFPHMFGVVILTPGSTHKVIVFSIECRPLLIPFSIEKVGNSA